MGKRKTVTRPGQLVIDRYMPGASAEAREQAYQNLRGLIAILVEIDDRLAQEKWQRDSRESMA